MDLAWARYLVMRVELEAIFGFAHPKIVIEGGLPCSGALRALNQTPVLMSTYHLMGFDQRIGYLMDLLSRKPTTVLISHPSTCLSS